MTPTAQARRDELRNSAVYLAMLGVFLCVALIVVDVSGAAGVDLDRHPVFQWVMMAAYSIIILSFLTLMGVILWRGIRGQPTRK